GLRGLAEPAGADLDWGALPETSAAVLVVGRHVHAAASAADEGEDAPVPARPAVVRVEIQVGADPVAEGAGGAAARSIHAVRRGGIGADPAACPAVARVLRQGAACPPPSRAA